MTKTELPDKKDSPFTRLGELLHKAFDIHDDPADQEVIRERLVSGGQVTGTNMCVLVLAMFIASIGLNMNSTAVIIGAMLISPLMGSILAAAYATASADAPLFRKSAVGFLFQIAFCLAALTLYFKLSPISTETSELLARTQPNIWDVLIALCGGLAGIIGITRREKSNVIPGVAIATALMPPLCTCGYGIARGRWMFVAGAFYLFVVNSYFIFLSSTAVLMGLKVPKVHTAKPEVWHRYKRKLIRNAILLMIPCVLVAWNMVAAQRDANTSLTGFEQTTVNPVSLSEQIEALYPQVKEVAVAQTAYVDEQEVVHTTARITLYVGTELTEDELTRLDAWLETVFGTSCDVEQTTTGISPQA